MQHVQQVEKVQVLAAQVPVELLLCAAEVETLGTHCLSVIKRAAN